MKKIIITIFAIFLLQISAFAQKVNVAFTIDNNYPIFTLLAINSIIENNVSNSDYTFYIIENNISENNKNLMRKFVEKRNQNIEFINFDTRVIDNGRYYFTFSTGQRITPIGMARIMLPKILPDNLHKIIYLDGDILVTGDLSNLYKTDLKDKYAGMVENINEMDYSKYKFKKYFNSGMIIMDLDKWRKDNIPDKMVKYLNDNWADFIYHGETDNSKYLYPDQDLINIILDGKIFEIEKCWNNQTIYHYSIEEFDKKGMIHYIGPIKPWDFGNIKNEGVLMYYDYWRKSSLGIYRYYYKAKVVKKKFFELCKTKIERYKKIYEYISKGEFTFLY